MRADRRAVGLSPLNPTAAGQSAAGVFNNRRASSTRRAARFSLSRKTRGPENQSPRQFCDGGVGCNAGEVENTPSLAA